MKSSAERTVTLDSLEIDFQHYWLLLKRRWRPAAIVFGTTLLLATVFALLRKPVYTAEGKVLVEVDRTFNLTGLGTEPEKYAPINVQSNPLKTETEVVLSNPIMQRTIDILELKDAQGQLLKPEDLKENLKVENITGTDVIQVAYQSGGSKEAAVVVNTIMSNYVYNNVLTNRSRSAKAREFIKEQLPRTEDSVQQADAALRKFREANQVTNLAEEEKAAIASLADLDNQITRVKTDLAAATTRSNELRAKVGRDSQEAIALSAISQTPGIQKVLEELQQVESQLEVERTRYQEQSPPIESLKERQAALRGVMQQRLSQQLGDQQQISIDKLRLGDIEQQLIQDFVNTEVERQSLDSRLQQLSDARNTVLNRTNVLPKLTEEQRELERRLEAAQSTYQTLLKKLQELQVTEEQELGNARIIETANVPEDPSNRKILIVLLGGVLAALLTIITVIILELKDRSIKTIRQANELYGYPQLGSIPLFERQEIEAWQKNPEYPTAELPAIASPQSPASAAYRMLQARLKFICLEPGSKILVVTSAVPKEGKSTVSANLAATMAQLGQRVLLIDADLHQPTQHQIWKLPNTTGLSNILTEQQQAEQLVEHLTGERVVSNLDIITAGSMPSHPLALIDSQQMKLFIQSVAPQYDFVIIDAPPLVLEAEALTLGKITDGILLVVRPGIVDFNSAKTARELLDHSQQNVLGMVVNGSASENGYVGKQYQISEQGRYVESR